MYLVLSALMLILFDKIKSYYYQQNSNYFDKVIKKNQRSELELDLVGMKNGTSNQATK